MRRTEQTFAILFGERPHEIVRDLREIDFGHFEMRSYEELKDDPEFRHWCDECSEDAPAARAAVRPPTGRRVRCGTLWRVGAMQFA